MQKTLLSLAAVAAVAAQLSAQCVAPTGTQTLETTFNGTTFYANTTAPLYGVSVDPGVAVRCDMAVSGNINLTSVGTNFLNGFFISIFSISIKNSKKARRAMKHLLKDLSP